MRKVIAILLIACISLSCFGISSMAADNSNDSVENQACDYIERWFFDNFSEHYDLSHYENNVRDFKMEGNSVYAKVSVGAITELKYRSVEDLPYMKGIKNKLKINSLAEVVPAEYVAKLSKAAANELQKSVAYATKVNQKEVESRLSLDENFNSILTLEMAAKNIIDNMDDSVSLVQANNLAMVIADKYVDAAECIDVGTVLTMDIVFEASYVDGEFSNVVLSDADTFIDANAMIPLSAQDMESYQAVNDINDYLNSKASQKQNNSMDNLSDRSQKTSNQTQNVSTRYLSTYDRIAARDYAWEHTYPGYGIYTDDPNFYGVTAPNTCPHGADEGAYVDRSYWNDDGSPYTVAACLTSDIDSYSSHCHNDCACFVSQCMVAGGVPTGGSWYYLGSSWSSCTNLKSYMTTSPHNYWDESTFATCNAGNIAFWSWGHVTLVTLNDTVTHRYTAHTNDSNNRIFNSSTMVGLYTINTN